LPVNYAQRDAATRREGSAVRKIFTGFLPCTGRRCCRFLTEGDALVRGISHQDSLNNNFVAPSELNDSLT
jgi:hypothetical protein